jgi:hypothetical protein
MDITPPKTLQPELIRRYHHTAETGESAADAILKYFNPCGAQTWYISEAAPVDDVGDPIPAEKADEAEDWHMFGFCDLGLGPGCAELGFVMLSDLQSVRGLAGLGIERDIHWKPVPLSDLDA